MIFDIIFGKSFGKVHCPFHDGDHTASLNIAADGRWHCFGCGAGGPNEVSFAQQYYGIAKTSATRLIQKLNSLPKYKYEESLEPWREVLRMNSLFDLANKGIGDAYFAQMDYEQAMQYYEVARDQMGYSNAYWEVRQQADRKSVV
jgi:tetratricopeptide (TPR) repeat protein